MFRRCGAALLCAAALSWADGAVSAEAAGAGWHVGETVRIIHPPVARNWRGAATEALVTRIWYPVDPSVPEQRHDVGKPGDPLFVGHPVADGAPLSAVRATYPLLVLSHGTGGSADSLDWLGAALAAHGYIVAGVNHPGNSELEPLTRDGFTLWWERATDASEVLDSVLADPKLGPHVDRDRIGAVGFSLGGYTVLELAGARTDLAGFDRFCASPAADAICQPPEAARIRDASGATVPLRDQSTDDAASAETKASRARSGASYRDPRVKAVFAIAPALGEALTAESLAAITIPVSLVAGAGDVTAPVDTNIRRIAASMPKASVTFVPDAWHYTFLDTCLPAVATRLARICRDNPGVDRDAVHAKTAAQAVDFFAATLPAKQP
ncbi:alpha/beta hydrolase [Paraburkholderia bryophila]|uniref:alpha/beta hydrolase family protein n=1 Tax=Burkholderiaceae TaxID=119060 RepID=UPI000558B7EB|nr:alpha/beta hydrolase [Burkholderia sp. 9120]